MGVGLAAETSDILHLALNASLCVSRNPFAENTSITRLRNLSHYRHGLLPLTQRNLLMRLPTHAQSGLSHIGIEIMVP